mgnify:CR=1 FL=1
MLNYFPLGLKSEFSLLRSFSKAPDIAKRLKELDLPGGALTDINSVSGALDFVQAMEKEGLKWILGTRVNIDPFHHITLLARNLNGWKAILQILSLASSYNPGAIPIYEYTHSKISHDDLICLIGGMGTEITQSDRYVLDRYIEHFPHLFLETPFLGPTESNPIQDATDYKKLESVANPVSYYIYPDDIYDMRILMCRALGSTLNTIEKHISSLDSELFSAFHSPSHHIPSIDELQLQCSNESILNTLKIADMCETYDITNPPMMPQFTCPNNKDKYDYLVELTRVGWHKKISGKGLDEKIYVERVKKELSVIKEAQLEGYFLIVQDYINWTKNQGVLLSDGRGSIGGSLVAYLLNITEIDPIYYDLIFERFYNAGRNTPGKPPQMPDIDTDFPKYFRENVIEYIRSKYGVDKVSQVVTFSRMQGRAAIKEVLRVNADVPPSEMNRITEYIPDEAKINDELQEMEEETGESSIILWTLQNEADKLREWCWIDENGKLQGTLAKRFEQAMRLEGTKVHRSRHASALVIAPVPLDTICPMLYEDTEYPIAGMEFTTLEQLGLLKMDILGLTSLDKCQTTISLLEETNALCQTS